MLKNVTLFSLLFIFSGCSVQKNSQVTISPLITDKQERMSMAIDHCRAEGFKSAKAVGGNGTYKCIK